jgi:uncharacterized alkaline shock family protein YloU
MAEPEKTIMDKKSRKKRKPPISQLDEYTTGEGKTTIAPEVLLTIARLATLEVPGVSRMGSVPGGVNRLFRRGFGEGVRIELAEDYVTVDLYVILSSGQNMRDVSRNIQREVARAINEMIGIQVERVNIHIEDIDFPAE